MNLKPRYASERGKAEHGWLHARFTFSFADYYDPDWCGFHSLVVMNNDIIEPGSGFPTHPHQNAEIFTYVISGELEHQDSMGNGSIIRPGNLQYMSAGSGVTHSEFNPSKEQATELYQIWMLPKNSGGKPIYSEKILSESTPENGMTLLFSGNGENGSSSIRQDAQFWIGQGKKDDSLTITPESSHPHAWIQVVSGAIETRSERLKRGDGLAIENLDQPILLTLKKPSTLFIFRLPPT